MTRREEYKSLIEHALEALLSPEGLAYGQLREAERYSLLAGGKRIRPMLLLEFCRACGGDINAALPCACAIEMLHTYSLIHDDLPCMDDDSLRRGMPTNHVVYGECTAVLAGDALQADAFATLLESKLPSDRLVECAAILARAAGSSGMCAGQFLDTHPASAEQTDAASLTRLHRLKTGALISAACRMGAAAAGATERQKLASAEFGDAVGLAFQIRDDMLDATATTERLGKNAGNDEKIGKITFATLLGEGCEKLIADLTERAAHSLDAFDDPAFLRQLAGELAGRSF